MLRRIAAGTSAALIAVGLAVAPARATGLPPATSAVSSGSVLRGPLPDISAAHRNSSTPPTVGTPIPETPNSPPSDESGPGGPGPGDSGPPSPSAPPVDSPPPPSPEVTPPPAPPAPPAEALAPTPPTPPAAPRGPSGKSVLPTAEPRLPQTAAESQPLTVAGGASLIAAGLAWIGGARRRRKATGLTAA